MCDSFVQICYYFAKKHQNSTNCQNMNFTCCWYSFKCTIHTYIFHKYAIISTISAAKINNIHNYCRNINLFCGWYDLNVWLFLRKYVTILLKICKIRYFFATSWQNVIFPRGYHLINVVFFFSINTILFRQKLAKFAANHRNMNFRGSWYF